MDIFFLFILLILIIPCSYLFYKRLTKLISRSLKRKIRMSEWMDMSPDERTNIAFKDNQRTMERKRELLKSIRAEYKKIKKL